MVSKRLMERINNGEEPTLEHLQCASEEYLPDELIKAINKKIWMAVAEGHLYTVLDIRDLAEYFPDKTDATNPIKIPDTVELIKLYYKRRGLNAVAFEEFNHVKNEGDDIETVYTMNVATFAISWGWRHGQEPSYR